MKVAYTTNAAFCTPGPFCYLHSQTVTSLGMPIIIWNMQGRKPYMQDSGRSKISGTVPGTVGRYEIMHADNFLV